MEDHLSRTMETSSGCRFFNFAEIPTAIPVYLLVHAGGQVDGIRRGSLIRLITPKNRQSFSSTWMNRDFPVNPLLNCIILIA
jgi:hypothetical protein